MSLFNEFVHLPHSDEEWLRRMEKNKKQWLKNPKDSSKIIEAAL